MIDTPHITQTSAQQTAKIHLTVPRASIHEVMAPAIGELMAAIAAQGIAPAGPLFSHHLKMEPDIFDFEISLPVVAPVAAVGRVQPGHMPAAKVARTVYHGSYEGLGAAWGEFGDWIEANGHSSATDLWECYVAGPESSSDPADWRTELNRPLTS